MSRLLMLFSVLLTCVVACQQEPTGPVEQAQTEVITGGVYRAFLPWSPRTLDPAFSTDIYSVKLIQQIFDGLVQFDQNLNVVPALSTDWRVSSDGLVYTFTIRQDARFHNGRQVTANDFVYSFTRILDPKEESSALTFFERIEGADAYRGGKSIEVAGLKALDADTLEIKLRQSYAPFLSILAMKSSKVVPKEEVVKWGKEFGHHPVGTGPFRLESWEGNRIVLSANNDYHEGRPYLDRVEFTVYEGSQNERIFQDFQAGLLEEALVFGGIREQIAESPQYQFVRKPTLSLLFYGMNCTDTMLKDKRVRQALNYAINKEKIIRQYVKDQFVPASTILPPGMPSYTPENKSYLYNPDKARSLLREAGYGVSQGKLSLSILSASKSKLAREELALVAADLTDVGVDLAVQYETDWSAFEARLKSGRVQLFRYAWSADIPDPDNFLSILCSSTSPYNFMRYQNGEVDRLLSQALVTTDTLERVRLYRKAEQAVLEDAPLIPWLYLTFESVFQPYVKGLEIGALGGPYIPQRKIWLTKH